MKRKPESPLPERIAAKITVMFEMYLESEENRRFVLEEFDRWLELRTDKPETQKVIRQIKQTFLDAEIPTSEVSQ